MSHGADAWGYRNKATEKKNQLITDTVFFHAYRSNPNPSGKLARANGVDPEIASNEGLNDLPNIQILDLSVVSNIEALEIYDKYGKKLWTYGVQGPVVQSVVSLTSSLVSKS